MVKRASIHRKTRSKISSALSRNNVVAQNWSNENENDSDSQKEIPTFSPGDLLFATTSFVVSDVKIDSISLLKLKERDHKNVIKTIADADFAIYVGLLQLNDPKEIKGKVWTKTRVNQKVYQCHHVILVNSQQMIVPEEYLKYLVKDCI